MGIVLKRGLNEGFPANSRPTSTVAERTQSFEPGNPPGIVQIQARWISTRVRPYLLIRRPSRIEVRHHIFKQAPDFEIGCICRRRRRLDPAPVERDRKVVFKVACLENRVLLARHLALHHLGDVVEDLEHTDEAVPLGPCLAAQGVQKMGGEHAVAGVREDEGFFTCSRRRDQHPRPLPWAKRPSDFSL